MFLPKDRDSIKIAFAELGAHPERAERQAQEFRKLKLFLQGRLVADIIHANMGIPGTQGESLHTLQQLESFNRPSIK